MSRRFAGTLLLAATLVAGVDAQQNAAPQGQPQAPTPPSKPMAGQETALGQPVNIKLDLTITDQAGPEEPAKRTVTMIVADRQSGSIRSTGNQVQARMYVDATPRILANGDVQVVLGLDYNPRQTAAEKPGAAGPISLPFDHTPSTGGSSLNQRITLVLQSGKPLVISQSSDPVSDRKITVEVRASILK